MEAIYGALTAVMEFCYGLCRNYGVAILLFTLLSKIALLPISVWVQKNSIRMVKVQPDVNLLHVRYFGDPDRIAEETGKLYKREKYHPMASLIPLAIQLLLLMGVIEAVKRGMLNPAVNMDFLGVDLSKVPSEAGGWFILSPVLAGASAWLMCYAQNRANVLQAEQSKGNQYGMLAFSVGLSLYLGWFVSVGVALYWAASNLMSIVQLYLLNWAIDPRKHIDYDKLEKSKEELGKIKSLGDKKRGLFSSEREKREKADYKRFFHIANKHVVFYSEKSGFWKYYKDIVQELLKRTNLRIHYVTNDPEDQVFQLARTEPRLLPYYIGPKRIIPLMMKLEADMVVMTTPDLDAFQIRRSYIDKHVEYVYTPHDAMSVHMGFREGALDHFDTVLCAGPQQMREIRATEKEYGLKAKTLVECGYCLLDDLIAEHGQGDGANAQRKQILIAPSWQEDNLLDSCVDELLEALLSDTRRIIVRPHPEYVKRYKPSLDALMARWEERVGPGLGFETDFSSNESIWQSDLLITDWSGIAYEYAYATLRPALFINTEMKVSNPNWERIGITPLEIRLRDQVGLSLDKDQAGRAAEKAEELLSQPGLWRERIEQARLENIFNIGHCGRAAADYIISRLIKDRGGEKQEDGK